MTAIQCDELLDLILEYGNCKLENGISIAKDIPIDRTSVNECLHKICQLLNECKDQKKRATYHYQELQNLT